MSKQITPEELAEIITGLLVKPEVLGEDPTPDLHTAEAIEPDLRPGRR